MVARVNRYELQNPVQCWQQWDNPVKERYLPLEGGKSGMANNEGQSSWVNGDQVEEVDGGQPTAAKMPLDLWKRMAGALESLAWPRDDQGE